MFGSRIYVDAEIEADGSLTLVQAPVSYTHLDVYKRQVQHRRHDDCRKRIGRSVTRRYRLYLLSLIHI